MIREQATALFERVYQQLSSTIHPCEISLVYLQGYPADKRGWHVEIESWTCHYKLQSEQDWTDYKKAHGVLETDEELEEYADAARAEAERELEAE